MSTPIEPYDIVSQFRCLGAECPDTCCRGWDMPVDARQRACYSTNAPELLATIDETQSIMKRETTQQQCAQLCEGKCNIHARYGEELLGDACYYYPRLVHQVGTSHVVAGTISCPEMLRLVLSEKDPFAKAPPQETLPRMPLTRRDLVPEGWTQEAVVAVQAQMMQVAGDAAHTPEEALSYMLKFANALNADNWREAMETARFSAPAEPRAADAHGLYYALALTEAFGAPNVSQRLGAVMATMAQQLDCTFDRAARTITLGAQANTAPARLKQRWRADAQGLLAPVLRRWLQAQITMTFFPFGGFPISFAQRAAVLVQRFATVRLALMCHVSDQGVPPDEETVLRVIQAISRFMDHLADADLTLMIHRDSGWTAPARLQGLISG